MAVYTSATGAPAWLPIDTALLVEIPFFESSVAAQVSTRRVTPSHTYRVPIFVTDPVSAFVSEGSELAVSDPVLAELSVSPAKVGVITVVSREMADDSDPAIAEQIGRAQGRDAARRYDQAVFAGLASPAPTGLTTLSGISTVVDAGAFADLDAFAAAISKAAVVGAKLTHFVTTPAVSLALAQVKQATGSNMPLLASDVTAPGAQTVFGVPLLTSEFCAANTVWGVDSSRLYTIVRADSTTEADRSVYFTSDRVALKTTMRVALAVANAASVVKITLA
jgi:HK97 family phage major capsid protein